MVSSDNRGILPVTSEEAAAPSDGVAENFSFAVRGIKVGDGPMRELTGPGSVTAVVGANNVGKSTLLRQVVAILNSHELTASPEPRIVTALGDLWRGTEADMEVWLRANSRVHEPPSGTELDRAGRTRTLADAMQRRRQPTPHWMTEWLVNEDTVNNRIQAVMPTQRPGSLGQTPVHHLHVLAINEAAFDRVNSLAHKLFGIKLYLDTISLNFRLHIGLPEVPAPPADRLTVEYSDAIAKLPGLDEQGDGFKSALGLLIPLATNFYPLTLIDEPEAFLHPPQARILGTEIARLAKNNRSQIIVATHDKNILQGLLQAETPVDILHLTRTDDRTTVHPLAASDVAELWKDPILRYGNALDGLFHSAVIVTEADRDSRFYEAAIDAERDKVPDSPAHNLMFMGANGKQNMAPIVDRLRKLGVHTISCPDLDILNDDKKLAKLVEAQGGTWTEFAQTYKQATQEFLGPANPPTVEEVKKKIADELAKRSDAVLTKPLSEALAKAVAIPKTNWSKLKESGDRAFKADKAAATTLLAALDELGIVTVRIGELENFLQTANASKGPEWLSEAFKAGAHTSDEAAKQAKRLLKAAGV